MPAQPPPTPPAATGLSLDAVACYRVLQARDARFDGHFFTGVRSTGIYCRPVCKVRIPLQKNCRFFTLPAQAEAAGFRPCLRCRPELAPAAPGLYHWSIQDASAVLVRQALQLLDAAKGQVAVKSLRDGAGAQRTESLSAVADWAHSLQSPL